MGGFVSRCQGQPIVVAGTGPDLDRRFVGGDFEVAEKVAPFARKPLFHERAADGVFDLHAFADEAQSLEPSHRDVHRTESELTFFSRTTVAGIGEDGFLSRGNARRSGIASTGVPRGKGNSFCPGAALRFGRR
jgi:hypothetical protein